MTEIERAVWKEFTSAGYQAFGICANPTCEDPDHRTTTCGRSPRARVCVGCFEYEFGSRHPSVRALEARQ